MTRIEPEEMITVIVRVPAQLARIIGDKARELKVEFAELAGQYLLNGIESERLKGEKNDKKT